LEIRIKTKPIIDDVIAILLKSDSLDIIKIISCLFIFSAVFLVSIPDKKVITD